MTPAARLQAAMEILEELESTPLPVDRFLRDYFRRRRYAGSKDRAAVGERVYDVLRHRNAFAWRMHNDSPRGLVIGSLLQDGQNVDNIRSLFNGKGYGPPPLTGSELQIMEAPPQGEAPLHVQGEYPQWLESELHRAFGNRVLEEMRALQSRAPIDLRVNTLKATRGDVITALCADGYDVAPAPHSPFAIRIPPGASGLEKTQAFAAGAFELQDEASQMAALLVAAKPAMRVLDLAAGGGGKALAIAAQMQNQGEIVASDVDAGRLRQLAARVERVGVGNVSIEFPLPHAGGGEGQGEGVVEVGRAPSPQPSPPLRGGEGEVLFDRVLVDAPCSGTGTWRRQPELRWRLTPERLERFKKTQALLLEEGAHRVKPGGRLIYANCSFLPCENEDQMSAFLEHHPEFAIKPAREVWTESVGTEPPAGFEEFFRATPLTTETDGFFTAVLERVAGLL